ncbi:DUF6191 domain-containing protein [Actinomadura fulvescens]
MGWGCGLTGGGGCRGGGTSRDGENDGAPPRSEVDLERGSAVIRRRT